MKKFAFAILAGTIGIIVNFELLYLLPSLASIQVKAVFLKA
jgi:hypothetical protein